MGPQGLMDTICDVIVSTIPVDCPGERAAWQKLREAMQALFEEGCKYVFPRPDRGTHF